MYTKGMNKLERLSRTIHPWILVVLGIIATLMALYEDHLYVRIIASFVTIFALVVQFLQSPTYVHEFSSDKWFNRGKGEFGLTVPISFHRKGNAPLIKVYEKLSNGRYSEVECDIEFSENGDVIIKSNQAIDGQVRIK